MEIVLKDVPQMELDEFKQKVNSVIKEAVSQRVPPGATVECQSTWTNSTLEFEVTADIGGLETKISGSAKIKTDRITIQAKIPLAVRLLYSEQQIQQKIKQEFRKIFLPQKQVV